MYRLHRGKEREIFIWFIPQTAAMAGALQSILPKLTNRVAAADGNVLCATPNGCGY